MHSTSRCLPRSLKSDSSWSYFASRQLRSVWQSAHAVPSVALCLSSVLWQPMQRRRQLLARRRARCGRFRTSRVRCLPAQRVLRVAVVLERRDVAASPSSCGRSRTCRRAGRDAACRPCDGSPRRSSACPCRRCSRDSPCTRRRHVLEGQREARLVVVEARVLPVDLGVAVRALRARARPCACRPCDGSRRRRRGASRYFLPAMWHDRHATRGCAPASAKSVFGVIERLLVELARCSCHGPCGRCGSCGRRPASAGRGIPASCARRARLPCGSRDTGRPARPC